MAYVNLYGVLRNLEDLCAMDHEAKALIQDTQLGIQFRVKGGPIGRLVFQKGACTFHEGKGDHHVCLYFTSCDHFNAMIAGEANPIPLKGFSKLGFLKGRFVKLTERLETYLRAGEEDLIDPGFYRTNTTLLFYTAFFALGAIGNHDPIGRINANRMPDGVIQVAVQEGPAVLLKVHKGHIRVSKGPGKHDASMSMDSLDVAHDILSGNKDAFSCIASGELALSGYIPLLEHMNQILGQVPSYLS